MNQSEFSPADTTPITAGQFASPLSGTVSSDPKLESSIELLNDLIQGYASCGLFMIKGAHPNGTGRGWKP